MNLLLIRGGYPPALIPVVERADYYASLESANMGELESFDNLIIERVESALKELIDIFSS
jgi:Fic family protein